MITGTVLYLLKTYKFYETMKQKMIKFFPQIYEEMVGHS
jgi:hypothetical protein